LQTTMQNSLWYLISSSLSKSRGLWGTCKYKHRKQLYLSSHQTLIMETEAISKKLVIP
jgi:hypothetical protein